MSYGSDLRDRIDRDEILALPGAHDPLTAGVADHLGFEAVYMTGYGTSLSKTGYPDAGFITMPEMIENAKNVQERVSVPVVADCDNGFGNATNVVRTVREYVKTGVAAIHIEDQTFPKRCGHVSGRQLIPTEEAVGKFRAAADVRDERDEEFVLIARTDARGAVDGSLDDAIDRANAYVQAGADVAFVEGPTDEAEVERIGEAVDAPLLYNCTGVSPFLSADRLQELGFDLVIYPGLSTRATIMALYERLSDLDARGTPAVTDLYDEFDELPFDFHQFAGFSEVVDWEERYMPETETEKYEGTVGADVAGDAGDSD
ncbi:MAG: oxaloacetate decarboxylase [Haloarculaceae archaeon]